MAVRNHLGCLIATVALAASIGCGKDDKQPEAKPQPLDMSQRCDQLAQACGDQDKHKAKLAEECKVLAQTHMNKACTDTAVKLFDCFEKMLCGGKDKVWTIEDLRKLAERRETCLPEREASRQCLEN